MPNYKVSMLDKLSKKIIGKASKIDGYLANVVNRTATYARKRSVDQITNRVALPSGYVNQRLKVVSRASPKDLSATIRGRTRATLLSRYPYLKSKDGVKVKVNQGAGYEDIKSAFIIRSLRGSLATGLAMRNSVYYEFYKNLNHDTPGKRAKLAKARERADNKPRGITVLHSRSINQLFDSVREDIQPEIYRFMADEFLKELNK